MPAHCDGVSGTGRGRTGYKGRERLPSRGPPPYASLQLLKGETERCVLVLDNAEKLPRLHGNLLQIFARLAELVRVLWEAVWEALWEAVAGRP